MRRYLKKIHNQQQHYSPFVQGQSQCDRKALPKGDRSSFLVAVDSTLKRIRQEQELCSTGNHYRDFELTIRGDAPLPACYQLKKDYSARTKPLQRQA